MQYPTGVKNSKHKGELCLELRLSVRVKVHSSMKWQQQPKLTIANMDVHEILIMLRIVGTKFCYIAIGDKVVNSYL